MSRSYQVRCRVLRDGAEVTDLHPVGPPTINCNSAAAIKMSMAAQFYENPEVNWLTDELQPIQVIDGKEFPVGVFPVGTTAEMVDKNGVKVISVEAYDRCLVLQQQKTESVLHFSAGMNYIQAVGQLLVDAGVSLYLATPTASVLATDREDWPAGTPYLTIINALLAEINYDDICFDASGVALLRPAKKPSPDLIDHQYGPDEAVLERPCKIETDVFDRANVFVVICSNPDLEQPLVARAENANPLSALSTFRRGRKITNIQSVNNIPDQVSLDEYARRLCFESMMTVETLTIYTANVPGHGVRDTIALDHPNAFGLYQEASWSMNLAPGATMTHTIRRSVMV